MANCISCGGRMGFLEGNRGLCPSCFAKTLKAEFSKDSEAPAALKAEQELYRQQVEAITLTTETAPNLQIVERIEIVTAECAYGMNIFKDLFTGVRDIVGGRSEAVQKTMRDARRTVLYELKKEAHAVGANAVVGVDLDYVELSTAGSMVMLVASGTAVIIED